ncbi:MAG: NAD kinase [Betaproteobacteria bacterium RIFCSPLOWO2_02_FULL_65_24]|uniref:NAD kinase n=1 Tax=Candidatus Muproteobacteria bacterium RBG_16_65_31 TaxID=1817759 RepID=A0A1F6TGM2_9PROT|nr:MAG: NAD kinase [Betaproteobacteria bacterium RIFCSPLOWO2_02_FULL_65_24]OGA96353.1 MAG: NAD kinase [Betaproteobacteria bacterium RIFCSPLOWO2_12_FULL_66_14]OGI44283.1 MAG: NAD kinase [Candidatus Muproteobacteria bacterium RBG_16_65_31]
MPAFNPVALIGRHNGGTSTESLTALGRFLAQRGCQVLLEKATAAACAVEGFEVADYAELGARAQLAVVLGGDGSMLSAARHLAAHGVPLVGVNQGRLGFMTDIALGRMLEVTGQLLDGQYSIEERTMLAAEVVRGGQSVFATLALNDVVVNKGAVGRLIEFSVHVDGEFVYDVRSDGLIVSTPTGSTAYALSSNGPILQPGVPGVVLVPVCPHTLSNRPIAVSDRSRIEVTIRHAVDAMLNFDGQPLYDLRESDRVVIRRAQNSARFVHPPGYSYFAMLREKLHWSEMY